MSIFEPAVVRTILCAAELPARRPEFLSKWKTSVDKRCAAWVNLEAKRVAKLKTPSKDISAEDEQLPNALSEQQLRWVAEVLEYVNYSNQHTRVHGNSKSVNQPVLGVAIPLMGPRFIPPPPALVHSRRATTELVPDDWYLRPVTVLHEFYYPSLRRCQVCGADGSKTSFEGWAATVPRRVHGISTEELAIGQQLKCQSCRELGNKPHTYALTSSAFWRLVSYDDIPVTIPVFAKRCALTRELFDIVVELRLGSTAAGFAETIRQLHLQRYLQDKREYATLVLAKISAPTLDAFTRVSQLLPKPFSEPYDNAGYALAHVSGDVLTDVYLDFVQRTRKPESEMYLKSLAGISLSIDTTFKITNKATVVQSGSSQRERLLKGGLFSGVNENNEIVFWRLCQTQSNKEIEETLGGFERRRKLLNAPPVELCASDNCCKVRSAIVSQLPDAHATLDIFHIVQRYTAKLASSKATLYRSSVARDIVDALIKIRASKRDGIVTDYWSQQEQETRLAAVWQKWSEYDIWQPGAPQMHEEQMGHVRKGCVTRTRSDIATDGSRVESSHKGWNSLQRSVASGIEVLEALGHDHVLRRNLRIAAKNREGSDFAASTYGSHHIALVNSIAKTWNGIVQRINPASAVSLAPVLRSANSDEKFGLVWAEYISLAPAVKREISDSFEVEVCDQAIELSPWDTVSADSIPADLQVDTSSPKPSPPSVDATIDLTQDDDVPSTALIAVIPVRAVPPTRNAIAAASSGAAGNSADYDQAAGPSTRPSCSPVLHEVDHTAKRPATDQLDTPPAKRTCSDRMMEPQTTSRPVALAPIFRTISTSSRPASTPSLPPPLATQSIVPAPLKSLTRSAELFKAATGVHPDALRMVGEEWFTFAEFRVEQELRTYEMTPTRLGNMTALFNDKLNAKFGVAAIPKDPRAIMSTLAALESTVLTRLESNDFTAKSGSEVFWRRQCLSFEVGKRVPGKSRKANTCQRCCKLMYPFGIGDSRNHARDSCTDGARVKHKSSVPYPQPSGIFVAGKRFKIAAFMESLSVLHDLLEHKRELPLEYQRFRDMLGSRVQVTNGVAYFKFFNDLQPEPEQTPLEELNGERMLRLCEVDAM